MPDNPQQGVHLFIVGISKYDFLPPMATDANSEELLGYGMSNLNVCVRTAFRILDYFVSPNADASFCSPLRSVRLILSASEEEHEELYESNNLYRRLSDERTFTREDDVLFEQFPANKLGFKECSIAWRDEVQKNGNNIPVFCFSGHGVSHDVDRALLLPGFNQRNSSLFEEAISSQKLIDGMNEIGNHDRMQTQYFFFDCCGGFLTGPELKHEFDDPVNPFNKKLRFSPKKQNHAVIFSSETGQPAECLDDVTLFCDAMLRGLRRGASSKSTWTIKPYEMFELIDSETRYLSLLNGKNQRPYPMVTGTGHDPISKLNTPLDSTDVWINTPSDNESIEVFDSKGGLLQGDGRVAPAYFRKEAPLGGCTICVTKNGQSEMHEDHRLEAPVVNLTIPNVV